MFCAAFPLCAAAAFVTNLIEMRLDAHKFLTTRRPLPQAADSIGVWFPIMQVGVWSLCRPETLLQTLTLARCGVHAGARSC